MIKKNLPALQVELLRHATPETVVAELYKRLRNCGHNCSVNFPVITEYGEEIVLDLSIFHRGELVFVILFNAVETRLEKVSNAVEGIPVLNHLGGYKDLVFIMQQVFDHFKSYDVYIGRNRNER